MGVVVSDTGPVHYLVLTGDIDLLPRLFGHVLIPERVSEELSHAETPEAVRAWIARLPSWLEVRPIQEGSTVLDLEKLDEGESAAIALAASAKAELLLMDDRDGVAFARRHGLSVTGTLGLLDLAARRGLIDLSSAFSRLERTSFYYRRGLLDALLARHEPRKS